MSFGGASGADFLEGRLPVFVFPTSLVFYSDDPQSHTRVITIYNPYDFPLTYKVLATDPTKFTVTDAEGVIKARCGIDVLIRHTDVCIRSEGVRDKFRVQLSEHKKKRILGTRDVGAMLLPTQDQSKIDSDKPFEEFYGNSASNAGSGARQSYSSSSPQRPSPSLDPASSSSSSSSSSSVASPVGVAVVAAACLGALMLPSVGDISPTVFNFPDYLYLTLHQKLLAAYILGMITVVAFRR